MNSLFIWFAKYFLCLSLPSFWFAYHLLLLFRERRELLFLVEQDVAVWNRLALRADDGPDPAGHWAWHEILGGLLRGQLLNSPFHPNLKRKQFNFNDFLIVREFMHSYNNYTALHRLPVKIQARIRVLIQLVRLPTCIVGKKFEAIGAISLQQYHPSGWASAPGKSNLIKLYLKPNLHFNLNYFLN